MTPDVRAKAGKRLKIIEGQLRGVQRLLDESAGCTDVLTQLAAIQNALRGVGRVVVDNHMRTCVSSAIKKDGGSDEINELMNILYKLNK